MLMLECAIFPNKCMDDRNCLHHPLIWPGQ